MQPPSGLSPLSLIWTLCSAALTLLGLFVLYRGLRPKRKGTTPFCRNCGYNLTGLPLKFDDPQVSAQCPECGYELDAPAAIITGRRNRRPGLIVAGAIGTLLGGMPLTLSVIARVRSVDWYRLKPTGWVIDDLETGSRIAVGEIDRRIAAGNLAPSHVSRLIDLSLVEQRRQSKRSATDTLMSWLEDFRDDGELHAVQSERYLQNAVIVQELAIRPTVVLGRQCPFRLTFSKRSRLYAVIWHDETRLDDRPVSGARMLTTEGDFWSDTSLISSVPIDQVGKHRVGVDVTVMLYEDSDAWQLLAAPLHTRRLTIDAECNVVADELDDPLRMLSSPELDATVLAGVSVNNRSYRKAESSGHEIVLDVKWQPNQQVPQAYDVFVRFNETELYVGSASIDRRRGLNSVLCQAKVSERLPAQFDVLLRSNAAVARRTIDLFEIWDGDLMFKDVNANSLASKIREHSPTLISRQPSSP